MLEDQAASLRRKARKAAAKAEQLDDQNEELSDPSQMFGKRHSTRVITITSGKGGVGKTNIAVNLAIALQLMNKRTLLIDADIGMANVDLILGSVSHRNMLDLLEDGVELRDIVIDSTFGINYVSGSSGIERALNFTRKEQKILHRKLAAADKLADIILIDTGAGLGRQVLDFIVAADETLLVTTNEPTSISDAFAVLKMYCRNSKKRDIRVVVNRIDDIDESEDVTRKLREAAQRFLEIPITVPIDCAGYVFEDRSVQDAVKKQMPFIVDKPTSPASRCIIALANHLLTDQTIKVKRGWRGFLRRLFAR